MREEGKVKVMEDPLDAKIIELYTKGLTAYQIPKHVNKSPSPIYRRLKRLGLIGQQEQATTQTKRHTPVQA